MNNLTVNFVLHNDNHIVKTEWLESLVLDVFPFELNELNTVYGNLVDLESELRGQTRIISKCGTNQYVPTNDGIIKNDKTQPIDTTMLHLPACQSIMYREVPMPPKINYNKC